MSIDLRFQITGLPTRWNGKGTPDQGRQSQRERKLKELLEAISNGDCELARINFTALVNLSPFLLSMPVFGKLSAALQSSNMDLAKVYGRQLKALNWKSIDGSTTPYTRPPLQTSHTSAIDSSEHRLDLRA